MYDTRSQDLAASWDLGGLIKLHTAWLHTVYEQRLLTGFPSKTSAMSPTSKAGGQSRSFKPKMPVGLAACNFSHSLAHALQTVFVPINSTEQPPVLPLNAESHRHSPAAVSELESK